MVNMMSEDDERAFPTADTLEDYDSHDYSNYNHSFASITNMVPDKMPATCKYTTDNQTGRCLQPWVLDITEFSVPIYGYILPPVIFLTVVTNSLICVVLLRRNMRSATNVLLVAMALSVMMIGVWPLPCYVYFYTLGGYRDWVPYPWCCFYKALTEFVPTAFHTASIWVTVTLAIHRYICVCHPQVIPVAAYKIVLFALVTFGVGSFDHLLTYLLHVSASHVDVSFLHND